MSSSRRVWLLLLLALGLVGAAWLAVLAGREHVSRLDLTRFEPFDGQWDIPERLARDEFVAGQLLTYITVAVALDMLALIVLTTSVLFAQYLWAAGRSQPHWQFVPAVGAVGLLVLGSAAWHTIGLLVIWVLTV